MVAFAEADGLGFGAAFEDLGAAEFQVFDQDDAVAVGEDVAVGVLDDAGAIGGFGFGCLVPFVTAGGAFVARRVVQNIGHLAHRAGGLAHASGIVGSVEGGNGAFERAKNKQFAARLSGLTLRCIGDRMQKPNYQFEKRRKEMDKKAKKEAKRRERLAAEGAAASGNVASDAEPTAPSETV